MKHVPIIAGAIAAVLGVAPARAQTQSIELAADAVYRHAPTGLSLPATLDGLPRSRAGRFEADGVDDFVEFMGADHGEDITVYIYRHVTGDVPVWFDRTRWAVEHRTDPYGALTPLDRPMPFTPPGQSSASGLTRVYLTGKGPYRSTGVAMMPLGPDWIVNIRYSSRIHSAEALAPRLDAVVAALGWPATIAAQPAAVPVADCPAPLAFRGHAKEVRATAEDALMGSLFAAIPQESDEDTPKGPPPVWCRDPAPIPGMETSAVYRANGDAGGYLIALGDAGRGITVGPNTAAALMALTGKKPKPSWTVSQVGMHQVTTYTPLDRLPPPDQAVEVVKAGHSISSMTNWGDKKDITINSSVLH